MNLIQKLLWIVLLVGGTFVAGPILAAQKNNLFDMVDQFDAADKLDFQAVIDRANSCTRERNFACSESELLKAAKVANSSQDKKTLALARQNVANERATVAREENLRLAEIQRREEEEEEREERREKQRRDAEREEREEREAERNRNRPSYRGTGEMNSIGDSMRVLGDIQSMTNKNVAEINRRAAEERAEQARARREANEQAAERRRDAERDRNARAARDDERREREQQAERERAREAEQKRQREEQAAAEKRAREQDQARLQEERRQQEARAAEEERAKQRRQTEYLVALRQGIRLRARTCMGGEGKYYVGGSMPGIKKELSCVDVYFEASCPGSVASSRGVITNFVPGGCLTGDAVTIDPKPACAVEQVRVDVSDVRGCK